jgi:RNA polymerase sigma factor (sigma-70 family)
MMGDSRLLGRYLHRLATRGSDGVPDCELLARFVRAADEAAFASLVERHALMVLGVCRRVLGNLHDAEDAFQATFLVLARKASAIRQPDSLANWLYGVAYRTALEARTKAVRRRVRQRALTNEPAVECAHELDQSDLRAVLDCEVKRLPDRYRSPFVLCCLEGRTNEEAARLLRCPKGTILSRLAWARQRLRTRLTRRGVTLSLASLGALWRADVASAKLVNETALAARLLVLGRAAATAEVISLTKGVLISMFIEKLKLLSAAVVALGLVGFALAWLIQPTTASDPQRAENAGVVKSEDLMSTLVGLEKRSWEATKKKDIDALRKLCAKDYVAIISDGSRLTFAEFVALFPQFEVKSYALSDVRVLPISPDVAILVYKAKTQTVILGMTLKEESQFSSTWVRQDGAWRNAFYQETLIDD